MTSMTGVLSDPRRRNLAILAAVALLCVAWAALALYAQEAALAPPQAAHEFFPGLAQHVRDITRIRIQSKANGTVEVAFKPEKGWVLPGRSDYRASFEQLQHTVVGLAALETLEPKTAEPDLYSYIGVADPAHGGNGTRITLYGEKGEVLADVIAGKTVDIGDPSGAVGLFVRKPDERQSWLAQSDFQPKSDVADWLDKTIVDIDRARIQEVDVQPATGPSFTLRREFAQQPDLTAINMPPGRELLYPGVTEGVASAITGMTFDDVRPARELDFANAAHVTVHTFDGLTVTVDVIKANGDYWAQFAAEAAKPGAAKEAAAIDAHAGGWAYKLPAYKGQQFMTTRDSLLKPLAAPAAPKK